MDLAVFIHCITSGCKSACKLSSFRVWSWLLRMVAFYQPKLPKFKPPCIAWLNPTPSEASATVVYTDYPVLSFLFMDFELTPLTTKQFEATSR